MNRLNLPSFGRALLAAIILPLLFQVHAQAGSWEFRVCADPNGLPFSHRSETGFENELAGLLADEMDANLTFDWTSFSPDITNMRLRGGECDAIMGLADGHPGVLHTISYYRSPYVFIYREDAGFRIESLEDPQLAELRIGVQNVGIPPEEALLSIGIYTNVVHPDGRIPNDFDRVVNQLLADEIDVGIVWGPVAGYATRNATEELIVQPVTPEIFPPFITMSVPLTMGVRPGDYSLRDRIGRAISARWDDIQALLTDHGVVTSPVPPSFAGEVADDPERVDVAVLLPIITGSRSNLTSLYDIAGTAALRGVEMAAADVNSGAHSDRFRLLLTSTPTAESARRAVDRLIALEGADVVIGGLGAGQAEILSEAAAAAGLVYFDLGSLIAADASPTSFYLHPGFDDVVAVLADFHGPGSWALVVESGGEDLARVATAVIEERDMTVAEVITVEPGQPAYMQEAQALRDVDAVLLALNPQDEMAFLGQVLDYGVEAVMVPVPNPVTQTRDYLGAVLGRVAFGDLQYRVSAYEANRTVGDAEFAERYASRYGEPLEPTTYLGFQALFALVQAVEELGGFDAGAVAEFLRDPATELSGPKGPVRFDPEDGRLVQPLDVITLDPEAEWSNTLAGKLGIVGYQATVEAERDSVK